MALPAYIDTTLEQENVNLIPFRRSEPMLLRSLSLTSTSNTDTTHLPIVPITHSVLIMRTRLSLGLHMDFGSRHSTLPKSTDFR